MLRVVYRPSFLRQYKKLPAALKEEVREKIKLFQIDQTNASLRVHKLKGRLRGSWSFWIDYKHRIVFEFESKNTVALLGVGDHSIYD